MQKRKFYNLIYILILYVLTSCSSYEQFEAGMNMAIDIIDILTPDYAVNSNISIEKNDNMMFYIIGGDSGRMNHEVRNHFIRRGFKAEIVLDSESLRRYIDALELEENDEMYRYIVTISYETSNDPAYANRITYIHLMIYELNGIDKVAESTYFGKPYLSSSSTRKLMDGFFGKWYEDAERAQAENGQNATSPKKQAPSAFFFLGSLILVGLILIL